MPTQPVYAVLRYLGTGFQGWQRQKESRTVQGELERSLETLLRRHVAVHAAGRTDAGVHALGQVVHFPAPPGWTAPDLFRALNAVLPPDIRVAELALAPPGFHARKSAASRRYMYLVGCDRSCSSPFRAPYEWPLGRDLDLAAMERCAEMVRGKHDFTSFCAVGQSKPHYRCTVMESRWSARRRFQGFTFIIEADRFLHRMVRFLVGTMVDAGLGKRPPDDVSALLSAADNSETSPPAPAHGLYFVGTRYPQLTRMFDDEIFPRYS